MTLFDAPNQTADTLACSLYDYVEIACMYRYTVRLSLLDGSQLTGVAQDTSVNEGKQECIALLVDNKSNLVELRHIHRLGVLNKDAKFDEVELNPLSS